jgi:Ribulose-phosphate 3 epimerase family
MDRHVVPNITIGRPSCGAIKRIATRPLDVHLMIEDPERYINDVAAAGANMLPVLLARPTKFATVFGASWSNGRMVKFPSVVTNSAYTAIARGYHPTARQFLRERRHSRG